MVSRFTSDFRSVVDRGLLAVGRGVLRFVEEMTGAQIVQVEVLKDEVIDEAEHLQAYGFASHPKPGAEAAVLSNAGSRNHPLVVVIADRRYRPALEEGEVILHDDQGQFVHIARDQITIHTDRQVRVEAQRVELVAQDVVRIESAGLQVQSSGQITMTGSNISLQASSGIDLQGGPYIHASPKIT